MEQTQWTLCPHQGLIECAVRGYHDLSGGKTYSTCPRLDAVNRDYCIRCWWPSFFVVCLFCFVLDGFFFFSVRKQQPKWKEVYTRRTSQSVRDQCVLLGRHLRVLILEQVHLLFTNQPVMVNKHVDAVKWKSVKVLLTVYKRSVTTVSAEKYVKVFSLHQTKCGARCCGMLDFNRN